MTAEIDPFGLPPRSQLIERLEGSAGAVLFADVDWQMSRNDAIGHQGGTAALVEAAGRIAQVVGTAGLVVRLSGDEFVALVDDPAQAEPLARAILASLARPFETVDVLCEADTAVGEAKREGRRGGYLFANH